MNISPSNMFRNMPFLERYHQNSQAILDCYSHECDEIRIALTLYVGILLAVTPRA